MQLLMMKMISQYMSIPLCWEVTGRTILPRLPDPLQQVVKVMQLLRKISNQITYHRPISIRTRASSSDSSLTPSSTKNTLILPLLIFKISLSMLFGPFSQRTSIISKNNKIRNLMLQWSKTIQARNLNKNSMALSGLAVL